MILRPAPAAYDQRDQAAVRDALRQADAANVKRGRNIDVGAAQVILTDADGVRWALVVATDGSLSTVAV